MSYYLRGTAFLLEPFAKHLVQVNFFKFMNKVTLKKGKLRIVFFQAEAVVLRCSVEKAFLKILQNSQKKEHLRRSSFINKVAGGASN